MVEAYCGTWRLTNSVNFDSYMKAIGISFAVRKIGNMTKPIQEIISDGENVTIKNMSSFKNTEVVCKLGEEFKEMTADGREVQSVISMQGDKLVQVQKWDNKESILTRELKDGKLILTCRIGDVECVRTYEK
uniref:Fatty acid-binding protein, brain-like n=1 Tax=Petromyzon marinus TaxID=7757 RepID=A0AAJ7UGR9_PETMA|nr:fatty acid-binding protein, brain-like [Petromyzon marinus]